jgi:ribosomal protein S18 acetylase RimI-like enzyme
MIGRGRRLDLDRSRLMERVIDWTVALLGYNGRARGPWTLPTQDESTMAETREPTTRDRPVVREARPTDAAGIARVHVDTWRTTYRGVVPDDHLDALSYEERERYWAGALERLAAAGEAGATGKPRASGLFVAEAPGGEVVGFAACGREATGDPQYPGELYAIYVLDAWQGHGLGRRLARAVADRLAAAGLRAMLVWVLADNPMRRFYEALGGRLLRERKIEIGGVALDEVAYGWQDTAALRGVGRGGVEGGAWSERK